MRLNPIAPKNLSSEQRPLFDSIQAGIAAHLQGFISKRPDGALIGPFNPMLHYPQFGTAVWDYIIALSEHSTLPKSAHEVAILVVGARYSSRYELYAHQHVAARSGLSESKIATIVAGERPSILPVKRASPMMLHPSFLREANFLKPPTKQQ